MKTLALFSLGLIVAMPVMAAITSLYAILFMWLWNYTADIYWFSAPVLDFYHAWASIVLLLIAGNILKPFHLTNKIGKK